MKQLLFTIFLAGSLFGNYAYQGENSGKIDMHGGKSSSLINKKQNFSNSKINSFGSMGLGNQLAPKKQPSTTKKEQVKPQNNTTK